MTPPFSDEEARFFTLCLADDRHPYTLCARCGEQRGRRSMCHCTGDELRAWLNAHPEPKTVQSTVHHVCSSARELSKPIKFHKRGCTFGSTATCLCGQEPFYSPARRIARGEIK